MVILIPKELNEIDQRTFIGTKFNLYITILFMPNTIACSILGSSRQFLTYVKLWTLNVKPHKSMCFHLYQIVFPFVKDNLCLTQKHLPDSCKYYFLNFYIESYVKFVPIRFRLNISWGLHCVLKWLIMPFIYTFQYLVLKKSFFSIILNAAYVKLWTPGLGHHRLWNHLLFIHILKSKYHRITAQQIMQNYKAASLRRTF